VRRDNADARVFVSVQETLEGCASDVDGDDNCASRLVVLFSVFCVLGYDGFDTCIRFLEEII
jgi:hypothetical protein